MSVRSDSPARAWRPPVDGVLPMEPGTIVAKSFAAHGDVVASELPAGRAAHFVLKGGFEGLGGAWQKLFEWCAVEKLTLAGLNWEVYGAPAADPAQRRRPTSTQNWHDDR